MLTDEQLAELENIELSGMSEFDRFMYNNGFELRLSFLQGKGMSAFASINGELRKEYNEYCKEEFENFNLDIELDEGIL